MAALGRHPLAWKPEDFAHTSNSVSPPKYVMDVGKDGVEEIEKALSAFKSEMPKPFHVSLLANHGRSWAGWRRSQQE